MDKRRIKFFGHSGQVSRLGLNRLNALTDGIVAFAMTLLVFNIDMPKNEKFSELGLLNFLRFIEHDTLIYTASFFLIAAYWVEHHVILHYIAYVNRMFVWLNFVFLFFITMLPLATRIKGIFEDDMTVLALFAGVHVACWLSLLAMWRYAVAHPALLHSPVDPAIDRAINLRLLCGPVVILGAVGISFINMRLGTAAFLLGPVLYLSQHTVDMGWQSASETES